MSVDVDWGRSWTIERLLSFRLYKRLSNGEGCAIVFTVRIGRENRSSRFLAANGIAPLIALGRSEWYRFMRTKSRENSDRMTTNSAASSDSPQWFARAVVNQRIEPRRHDQAKTWGVEFGASILVCLSDDGFRFSPVGRKCVDGGARVDLA